MKILSASQIRETDQFTIENEPISSIDLMERASNAFVEKFLELFAEKKVVHIFCGIGNNGGDGLAIGRILKEKNWDVLFYVLGNTDNGSADFLRNLKRTPDFKLLESLADFPSTKSDEIVIDGLFGSGLSRSIDGLAAELIEYLNGKDVQRVAIDIASGLFADKPIQKDAVTFKPLHTISFQLPKLVFFFPEYYEFVGKWHVITIGLNKSFISEQTTVYYFTNPEELKSLVPRRSKFSHKFQVGKLLLTAGSKGKMGAAALCTKAALLSGIGLINVQVPRCGVDIIQMLIPEAMVIEDPDEENISKIQYTDDVVAIGPGIGTSKKTRKALVDFLKLARQPIVLDADAINIIAIDNLIEFVPKDSILTPHTGEFKRLVGEWRNDFDKLDMLRAFCIKHELNVVLKGAYSAVCNSKGIIYFNPSGNPGMATAGSGDVLTGIVSSLLAQHLRPADALKLGVYIHGLAGDFAAEECGEIGMIASDINSFISNSFTKLRV